MRFPSSIPPKGMSEFKRPPCDFSQEKSRVGGKRVGQGFAVAVRPDRVKVRNRPRGEAGRGVREVFLHRVLRPSRLVRRMKWPSYEANPQGCPQTVHTH